MDQHICSNESCPKPVSTAGYCRYHYEKQRRDKSARRCSCGKPVLARGLCGSCYPKQFPPKRKPKMFSCRHCGTEVSRSRDRGDSFCSPACAQNWRAARDTDNQPNRSCVICGKRFRTEAWNCTTCSRECAARQHSIRRSRARALRRSRLTSSQLGRVDSVRVFNADGYRCHLCGGMTVKSARVPHPHAPTVDHIIPLSEGGQHDMSNVRTACFICNSRKGARGGGEQFAIALDLDLKGS